MYDISIDKNHHGNGTNLLVVSFQKDVFHVGRKFPIDEEEEPSRILNEHEIISTKCNDNYAHILNFRQID